MRITFLGVRGTNPVTEPDFQAFGGETTSLLVEGARGERLFLDAGTGIRSAGVKRRETGCLLLLTHYHLDHLMGLPHLAAFYDPSDRIVIGSPLRAARTVEAVITRILANPFWPVPLEKFPAKVEFLDFENQISLRPFPFGKLGIRWVPLHHPGGSTAYRIDEPSSGASFVFATDVEWRESTEAEKMLLINLCQKPRPATVLIMDGQFSAKNYPAFRGWGHSAWEDAREAADRAGVKKLIVTHHAPQSDDRHLAKIESALKKARPGSRLARQGLEINLGK